jgi:hypothetical protein
MADDASEDDLETALRRKIEAYHDVALLYTAVALRLPDLMGADSWTAGRLAGELGLQLPQLRRFLRGLCIIGICEERPDASFALTPLGQSLTSGSRLANKAMIVVEQYWVPWAGLITTLETGKPAFAEAFGMSIADWRREHTEQGKLFESYLMGETFDQAGSIIEALNSAGEVKRVAAIGGGCGALLAALMITHPHLAGTLFERPHIVALAEPFLQVYAQFALPERVKLVAGDARVEVPVEADLYLLHGVLQQWGDADALAILRSCRKAMPEGARLVIIERLMPERAWDDPAAIMLDLHMMAITGGRARSLAEFEALLAETGFALANVTSTPLGLSLIEARLG